MRRWWQTVGLVAALVAARGGDGVSAQGRVLGTFAWQMQPYCNVVTVTLTEVPTGFAVDGSDDQCGSSQRGSVVGMAVFNADGTVGLNFAVVGSPSGVATHVSARVNPANGSGSWSDSAGNSGTFALGAAGGGAPRPIPPGGIAPGIITAAHLAPGAVSAAIAPGSISAAHLAPGLVTQAVAAAGTCPVGQYQRGITAAGALVCEPFYVPNISSVADDTANAVGYFSSIAVGADGLPVISHWDEAAAALRVTKCGNPACTAGNTSTTVDDPANAVGYFTSIAIGADGLPVISHLDLTAGALRVTHCGNAACTAGNVSTTVDDPANAVGHGTSIAIGSDGLPVVSHQDLTAGALRVTHCGNPACTAGNASTTVDDPANAVGYDSSIAIGADGTPVISHRDGTAGALRVTHCGNAACTAGNVSTTVDDPTNAVGHDSSIAIGADGKPVISHRDTTANALRVTHCGNAACTAGNVSTTVDDPAGLVGFYTSIVIGADGFPVISHRVAGASALRVTKCGNAACTVGNTSTTVDDPANAVGYYTSIAIGADGLPVISHLDLTAGALRVTKCGTQSCR